VTKKTARQSIDIGARLKATRVARRLSQRELARKSGVTNGLISQIEQNSSSPSVSSLKRILDAIPMTLSEFFADDFDAGPKMFFGADELRELNPSDIFPRLAAEGATISLRQVGDSTRHTIQMLHERYRPGADTGAEMYSHNGEEAGIVVSGWIEITVGQEVRSLGPGDAYIFDSRIPHRFRNAGQEDCVIISACTPPSF
jgi:transcriptional regulator with XRE-family HTH domain